MMQKNNKLFTLPNVKTAVKVSSESLHTHPHPTFAIRLPVLFNTRIYFLTSCFRSSSFTVLFRKRHNRFNSRISSLESGLGSSRTRANTCPDNSLSNSFGLLNLSFFFHNY